MQESDQIIDPTGLTPETGARRVWRTAVSSGTYFASDAIARAVSLGLVLAFTRVLTPSDYATLALASTVTALLTPVIGLSVTSGLTRLYFETRGAGERRRLFASVLGFIVVVPTAGMIVLEILGDAGYLDFFAAAPWNPYLRLACWTAYALLYLDIPIGIAIAEQRPTRVFWLGTANALVLVAATGFFVLVLDRGVRGVLEGAFLAAAVMAVTSIVLTLRLAGRARMSRILLLQALAFGIPLVPHAIAQWLLQVSDRALLTHYVDAPAVGTYYIGYSVAAVAGIGALGVAKAMNPVVTSDLKMGREDHVVRLGTYAFAALVWLSLLIGTFGASILGLLVPSGFAPATRITSIVALAYVAFSAYTILAQSIWYTMRTWWVPVITLAAAAVNVGLNLLVIPRYGIEGAAWDTVAGFGALAIFQGWWAHRVHPVRWDYRRGAVILVAAAGGFAVAAGLRGGPVWLELLGDLAAIAIFPVSLAVLGFATGLELDLLGRYGARANLVDHPTVAAVIAALARAVRSVSLSERPPSRGFRLTVIGVVAAFVAATTHWMTWNGPIVNRFAADEDDYAKIARSAPHFTWPQINGHLSMWPVHYVVGLVAKATGLPLHVTYYLCAIAVLSAIVVCVDRCLRGLAVTREAYVIAIGALLLDPYGFRYLALAPAMINDGVFLLGLAFVAYGIVSQRSWPLFVGAVAAALARGFSFPAVAIGLVVWVVFLAPAPKPMRRRMLEAAALVALPAAAAGAAFVVGRTTPGHANVLNASGATGVTVVGDLLHLPVTLRPLASHVVRTALGIALPLALLLAAAFVSRTARLPVRLPRAVWGLLVLAGLLVAEALSVGASTEAASTAPRLSSLAIVPAAIALGGIWTALRPTGVPAFSPTVVAPLLAILAVASLSHRFADIGPRTPAQFVIVELAAMVAAVVVVLGGGLRLTARHDGYAREAK